MSTNAMDMEEGTAITKMILDKIKIKARWVQRGSWLSGALSGSMSHPLRPLSVPLPEYEKVDRAVG